jgi:hypothetical protein
MSENTQISQSAISMTSTSPVNVSDCTQTIQQKLEQELRPHLSSWKNSRIETFAQTDPPMIIVTVSALVETWPEDLKCLLAFFDEEDNFCDFDLVIDCTQNRPVDNLVGKIRQSSREQEIYHLFTLQDQYDFSTAVAKSNFSSIWTVRVEPKSTSTVLVRVDTSDSTWCDTIYDLQLAAIDKPWAIDFKFFKSKPTYLSHVLAESCTNSSQTNILVKGSMTVYLADEQQAQYGLTAAHIWVDSEMNKLNCITSIK